MYYGPPAGPEYHPMEAGESLSQRVLRDPSLTSDRDAAVMTATAARALNGDMDAAQIVGLSLMTAGGVLTQAAGGGAAQPKTWWDNWGTTVLTATGVLAIIMLPAYINAIRGRS